MTSSIDRNGSGRRIRVLVVDDSALMRQMLGDILKSDPRIEVVGKPWRRSESSSRTL